MIDKIFTEGDMLIPLTARKDFKMIYVDHSGKEYYEELKNSDLIFYNEFYDRLRIKEFTFHKKELFMRKKYQAVSIIFKAKSFLYSKNIQCMGIVNVALVISHLQKHLAYLNKKTFATFA